VPIDKRGIDHVIVLVRDMDQAVANYVRLGFQPTPRMHHPFGTANNLFMFRNSFLEILGVARAEEISGIGVMIRDLLQQKEGASHFALQSENAFADREEFAAKGLRPSEVSGFERVVTLPSGERINAVVSVCTLPDAATPRVLMFVSQQHVAEAIWVPQWQSHPNGAEDVSSITIISNDPRAEFSSRFERLFDRDRIVSDNASVKVDTGGGRIEVLTPACVEARFAGASLPLEPVLPYIAATSVRVASLRRVADIARGNGISLHRLTSGSLLAEPGDANGVAVEFVET
jgi:catechol 2,3-dioxygenase-like lactoylglutathione lyase family enzyme